MSEKKPKKTFSEKTPSEKKKVLRGWQYGTWWGQFVVLASPYVGLAIANGDKYFVQYDGTKISIAFFLGLAILGFTIWSVTYEKFKDSYLPHIIKFGVYTAIIWCVKQIIDDVAYIMIFGFIAFVVAGGIEEVHKKLKQKADHIDGNIKTAEDNLEIEQAQQEIEEKRTKVKVKIKH